MNVNCHVIFGGQFNRIYIKTKIAHILQVHKEEFTKIFTALYTSHKLRKPSITSMDEQPNKLRYIFSRNRTEDVKRTR